MKHKIKGIAYIGTISVGGNYVRILRKFPDSIYLKDSISISISMSMSNPQYDNKERSERKGKQTSPGCSMVLYFLTKGERASSLN